MDFKKLKELYYLHKAQESRDKNENFQARQYYRKLLLLQENPNDRAVTYANLSDLLFENSFYWRTWTNARRALLLGGDDSYLIDKMKELQEMSLQIIQGK